jgi:predicted TIM-barrel fold metal-dependent hydrolase
MFLVDSQIHLWARGRIVTGESAHHRQTDAFDKNDALREMDAAGVSRVIIVPPGWVEVPSGGTANDHALLAAAEHPERFAVMGKLRLDRPELSRPLIRTWKQQPGMLGMRLVFNKEFRHLLTSGDADWVWPHLEQSEIPIMVLVPGMLDAVEKIAERHPGLRITIDHLAVPRDTRGPDAFRQMPQLLGLARYPNVSVKASGLPGNSVEAYPFRDVAPHIRQVYDAYGPRRVFWGTDLTRMRCTYRQCITQFTEELSWLRGDELRLVMGRGVCEWLGWPLPSALP